MGKRHEEKSHRGRHWHGQHAREKMLCMTCHQGNTNQNHKENHLTPVRMGKINKAGNHKCWRGCGGKGTLLHCWWECELVQPLWKTVRRFLKVLKIGIPGWRSSLAPASGPGHDPGDPGSNPTSGSRCMEPASPLPESLPPSLSLSLCDYHK